MRNAHATIVCETCGQTKRFPPSAIRNGKRFCSLRCYTKRGSDNPKWRGGVFLTKGRRAIYKPGHRNAKYCGTHITEHRLVMSEALGRPLTTEEIVHHRNGDITDNRLENLALMSQSQHASLHARRVVTKDISDQIRQLYLSGLSVADIARKFNLAHKTATAHAKGLVLWAIF